VNAGWHGCSNFMSIVFFPGARGFGADGRIGGLAHDG
jgi:hypothetical protein